MNISSGLLSETIVNALGWNIFHILWQGIVVSVCLYFTLKILRNKSAQLRYLISFISLFLLLGLSIYNFSNNYHNKLHDSFTVENKVGYNPDIINHNSPEHGTRFVETFSKLKNKLKQVDTFFPLIVNIWIIGILVFTIKFIIGLIATYRIKSCRVNNLSEDWVATFKQVQVKLGINKTVKFIESQIVKIPVAFGYLKPVLIIPAEMISGIPSNQLEAIIAHELAHIRRNDYILNVLQVLIETMLFFHPAVWYISSQIRKERENCCDDIALTVCDGSLDYVKALVSVQEFTMRKHYSAVAFSGRKKHLLNRIKRMIMKPKTKSNNMDKIIVAFIILFGALTLSFTYKAETSNYIQEKSFKNIAPVPVETLSNKEVVFNGSVYKKPEHKDTTKINHFHHNDIDIENNTITKTHYDKNGVKKEMRFTLKNGIATDLYVDGKKIPESDYYIYQPEIDNTISNLKEAKPDIRNAMKDIEEIDSEKMRKEMEEALENIEINMEGVQEEIETAMEEINEIDVEKIMKDIEVEMDRMKDFEFDNMDIDVDMEKIRKELEEAQKSISKHVNPEEIKKEIKKAREEMYALDHEKIKQQIEENIKHFEEFDKKETLKELQKKLEEIENLELEKK